MHFSRSTPFQPRRLYSEHANFFGKDTEEKIDQDTASTCLYGSKVDNLANNRQRLIGSCIISRDAQSKN